MISARVHDAHSPALSCVASRGAGVVVIRLSSFSPNTTCAASREECAGRWGVESPLCGGQDGKRTAGGDEDLGTNARRIPSPAGLVGPRRRLRRRTLRRDAPPAGFVLRP